MLVFQRALASEAPLLTKLAFASKSYWPYSIAQLQSWAPTLEVTPSEMERYPTVGARSGDTVVGFYQLRAGSAGTMRLEHFWLLPAFMGRGFGRAMLANAAGRARELGAERLTIEADPHAEAFYLACGAVRVGNVPAPIEGTEDRVLPVLELPLPLPEPP
jgi:GNAT superfamily N-acetyltransferase